jgi:hypothetical protein
MQGAITYSADGRTGSVLGRVAKAVERWQTSFIFNAASAIRTTALPGVSHFCGNPGYMIASPNWNVA